MKAYLVGKEPDRSLGYAYTDQPPYDGVVIGSLSLGQLLAFSNEEVLAALAAGKPVILYTPGLPEAKGNRSLSAALAAKHRELKNWGIVFTDGAQRRLVTAKEAQALRQAGKRPAPGSVLTPLAKEILEESI